MTDTAKTLSAPNVLLMGPAGTGKTDAIGSLVDAGVEVFYLDLENGLESLLGYWVRKGKDIPPNLHWHKIAPPKKSFKDLAEMSLKINTLDVKTLANMNDPNRHKSNLFIKIQEAMCDFPDDRTSRKYGSVDLWGTDRAIVFDGLTGLGLAAMSMVVGGQPIRSQQAWGMAMDQVEVFLRMICDQCPCWFVLLAHVERELDEILGGVKIMPGTLGRKLAPKLGPMFSDVILTIRDGNTWTWDTANSQADLKARNLPWKAGQTPSFIPIVTTWKARAAAAAKAQEPPTPMPTPAPPPTPAPSPGPA